MTDLSTIQQPTGPRSASLSPFRRSIPLGRWGATRVYAHWSIVVTLFVFADLLATSALPAAAKGYGPVAYWLAGTATAAVFLVTLLAHELAHAVMARHYGMPVKRITLWLLGGMTELDGESPSPRADALIAAAGPLASLIVGAASLLLAWGAAGSGLLGAALSWLAGVSVLLCLFNLLPAAPLDGGRLLRAVLWRIYGDRARAQRGAAHAGQGLGVVLVVLGGVEVVTGSYVGLWLMLSDWFVLSGAGTELSAAQADTLRGLHAADVMRPVPVVVPDWWTVTQLMARLSPDLGAAGAIALVDFNGRGSGAVTLADLEGVPVGQRDEVRIREVNRHRPALIVAPTVALADIAARLRRHDAIAVVVDEFNRPVGILIGSDFHRTEPINRSV